ncbi:hypothetical protein HGP17_27550 [Rhizobium sp. P38BS-XIX]|uniref:hypothetical protein n=1 Tax=Rhizobium sp. P38BS-XIX TaxID=2726740 RepID=UPI001457738D|nr:hypothetical protein [Rhizobium sp. P38BS-XIX]NLS00603.1 hypothetical protein [Rhizobium sp. P38BS-XIX]
MIKKTVLTVLLAATVVGGALAPVGVAQAQQYDGRPPYRGDYRGHDDWRRHHHHGNGGAIAGGVAAGLIGGLIGGAIVNNNSGPVYAEPPPPPPRCWFESRPVQNQYDDGYHYERMRVCD